MSDDPERLDTAATRLSSSTPLYDQARAHDAGRALARLAESRRARHRALADWPEVTASIDLRDRSDDASVDLDRDPDRDADLPAPDDELAAPSDGQALARPDDGTAALAMTVLPGTWPAESAGLPVPADVPVPVPVPTAVPAVVSADVPVPAAVPVPVPAVGPVPVVVMPEPAPGPDPVPSPATPPVPSPVPAPGPPSATVLVQLVVRRAPAVESPAAAAGERLAGVRAALLAEQHRAHAKSHAVDASWPLGASELGRVPGLGRVPESTPEPVLDLRDTPPPAVFDDADRFLAHLLETL